MRPVVHERDDARWVADGKFFRAGLDRVRMKAITYGPFPSGWPEAFDEDFRKIAGAGFNTLRLFEMPDRRLLDAAKGYGLKVMGGLKWGQNADFLRRPGLFSAACVMLCVSLRAVGSHPALAGVYVGNEVPADLVRWMGPLRVRRALEELISLGKEAAPHLLFAYASYPTTEYLEPENADFTAFNVYLENQPAFHNYLQRLHHIAGDRPLVISEFGLDSRRNGLDRQAEVLSWGWRTAWEVECAGMTLYAWSDRWWNNDAVVTDWDFGLTDREGRDKPALTAIQKLQDSPPPVPLRFSVIVCTRNGRQRIGKALRAIHRMAGGPYETIVVDDGSTDGTADVVARSFPWARLLVVPPGGLSAARNIGAAHATGEILAFTDDDCEPDIEWLQRAARAFESGNFAAAGGPNLPPPPGDWQGAVVGAAPGAPSHVMLDDVEAEHLPGCNLLVTKSAFDAIGGFDIRFRTAGDDVDFCWNLRAAGFRLGFVPGAFVWHHRRPSIAAFLRQQIGYGRAEGLLLEKHPERFSPAGDARWRGFVYGGGPVRVGDGSIIYHGPMGSAGYQSVVNRMLPLRDLAARYDSPMGRFALAFVRFLQPRLRAWVRNRRLILHSPTLPPVPPAPTAEYELHDRPDHDRSAYLEILLHDGWTPGGDHDPWDVEKEGTRLLLATQHGPHGTKSLLLRVWGEPSRVPFL